MRKVNYNNLDVTIKTGTEGWHFDPTSYTEYSFIINKRRFHKEEEVVIHFGLSDYITVNGEKIKTTVKRFVNVRSNIEKDNYNSIKKHLKKVYKMDLEDLIDHVEGESYHESISICQECKSDDLEWKSGYPGEIFLVCNKCGHIVESEFHPTECM